MILNLKQIKSITRGAESIERKKGVILFNRFTKKELNYYKKTEYKEKSLSTSCVVMEFKTDGDYIEFKINAVYGTTRTYFAFDIFVDGVYTDCLNNYNEEELKGINYKILKFEIGAYSKRVNLNKGEKTIKVIFPWSVKAELVSFEVGNATYITPIKKEDKVVFYGDSITHGYDALHPSNAYAMRFSTKFDMEVINKAIGGEVYVPNLLVKEKVNMPKCLFVAYGSNDWKHLTKEVFTNNCKEFYKKLAIKYPNDKTIVITPIWRENCLEKTNFDSFLDVENIIKEICANYDNITVVSGWEFNLRSIAYFVDGLHPTDSAFEIYFNDLMKKIDNIIEK